MSDKYRNERGEFLFAVKEHGAPSFQLFIAAEPRYKTTTLLKSAVMAFDIKTKDGNEAQRIADFLNKNIERVSFTIFPDHPMYDAIPD